MPKNNSKAVREFRRSEAEKRQGRYNALSTEQKVAALDSRPGESRKERARLAAA